MEITNEQYTDICQRIRGTEEKFTFISETLIDIKETVKEQKVDFASYRSDLGDIVTRHKAEFDLKNDKINERILGLSERTDKELDELKLWNKYVAGGAAVLIVLLGIVGKDIYNAWKSYPQTLRTEVSIAVQQELSRYNIEIK